MPVRIEESEWRQKRWERHGPDLFKNIKTKFFDQDFNIQLVAGLKAVQHLSDRNAYDVSTAVCRELEVRKLLRRHGRMLTLTNKARKLK